MSRRSDFVKAAGVELHATSEGDGPPVLLLHGFTGSGESLRELARGLRADHRVVRLDLIGHGRSAAPDDPRHWTLEACALQVAEALTALAIGSTHVVGYSMGGRVALALCAFQPERVRSGLLIGASAGLEDPAARRARRRADEALADSIEHEGIERFVERWMALPLFDTQRQLPPELWARARAERLRNRPSALAASLRGMGSGAQPPLHARLPELRAPMLLVAGALDEKFGRIARELARRLPDARFECLRAAGHACHLEQPEAFLRLARSFIGEVDAAAHPHPESGARA